MDKRKDPVSRLVAHAPSWSSWWDQWRGDPANNAHLPYLATMGLGVEVVHRVKSGRKADALELFGSIERALQTGDPDFKQLLVIGFIEGLQNLFGDDAETQAQVLSMMGHRTRRFWNLVEEGWQGSQSWEALDNEIEMPSPDGENR